MPTKATAYDIVLERLVAALDRGVAPWRKPWSSGVPGVNGPVNIASKKAYTGANVMLLGCTPYTSPWFGTYKQVAAAGGQVRKGEKSWPVVFYKSYEKTNADGETESKRVLHYYSVFNAEQCDNLDVPAPIERDNQPDQDAEALAQAYITRSGVGFHHGPLMGGAFYAPRTDDIEVPAFNAFESTARYYGTVFHEMGHSTGHVDRLARPGVTGQVMFGSMTYSEEELVAEMCAAFLCAGVGLDVVEPSASYLESWSKSLKGGTVNVLKAASAAQKAANYIQGEVN